MENIKETITYEDFDKLDIRVGTVIEAAAVENSQKLVKLVVDFGEEKRQILTGMLKWYTPESFVGKQSTFLINLPSGPFIMDKPGNSLFFL